MKNALKSLINRFRLIDGIPHYMTNRDLGQVGRVFDQQNRSDKKQFVFEP